MTLVFSDTHLGKYDKKKDEFLKNLIKDFDRIIVNGDFYDSWVVSSEEFVNSKYIDLLKLLKSKETIYTFGNHDSREERDFLKPFFKYQGDEYNIQIGDYKFHFEPGHRFVDEIDSIFYTLWYGMIDIIPQFLKTFSYKIEMLVYNIFPKKVGSNRIGKNRNDFVKQRKPKGVYYVVGDTHVPEIDKENMYINTGCILGNFISYVVIDDNGEPTLIQKVQGAKITNNK